jgi:hypothetical protein
LEARATFHVHHLLGYCAQVLSSDAYARGGSLETPASAKTMQDSGNRYRSDRVPTGKKMTRKLSNSR